MKALRGTRGGTAWSNCEDSDRTIPDIAGSQPELIAHYLTQAELSERAVEYFQKAAQKAIERSANAEATAHLRRALDILEALGDSPEHNRGSRTGSDACSNSNC